MKMVRYTQGLLIETAGRETDWEISQESHHSACPQTTTPLSVRHCLEVTIWDGPLQVEGDPSAHPWKPAAAKWSLITSAGAPPYSHRVRSITPRNLVRRKTADEAARQ